MPAKKPMTYASAGHKLERSDAIIADLKKRLPHIGGFGGAFPAPKAAAGHGQLLVSGADGVGTKLLVAIKAKKHDTVGIDCVAMVVNDLIVVGAKPLFFLDYVGAGELEPGVIQDVMTGLIEGCRQAGCLLLGGETAELSGMYGKGIYDLVGFAVGVVERGRAVEGKKIRPGDVVIALESSGLHSNGFHLARAVFDRLKMGPRRKVKELGTTVSGALLEPTRIYVPVVLDLLRRYDISGMANITGGGLEGNLNRTLPAACDAEIDASAWPRPPIFDYLQAKGPVEEAEMFRTFNMGVGYTLVVPAREAAKVVRRAGKLGFPAYVIGEIKKGTGEVRLV